MTREALARVDARWPEIEYRFLVDADEAGRFLDAVHPHLPVYVRDPDEPVEFIRTTYYDTEDLTLFRASGSRSAWRVRVRQYASAPDLDTPAHFASTCAFEVVEHAGSRRRKMRALGSPHDIARILTGAPRGRIAPLLDYAARAVEGGQLRPSLTTWFRRMAHASPGVRVTVDQRIEFARPTGLAGPGEIAVARAVVGRGPPLVLEVKLQLESPVWLLSAMQQLFLVTQFSKYRDGLLALRRAERDHLARPHVLQLGGRVPTIA
jgi:hypothetical protein